SGVAAAIGIIVESVGIADLKPQFSRELAVEINEAVVACVVARDDLKGREGVSSAQRVRLLADGERITHDDVVARVKGVVQADLEALRLVVVRALIGGLVKVIFEIVLIGCVNRGLFPTHGVTDAGVDIKSPGRITVILNGGGVGIIEASHRKRSTPRLRLI